MEVAEAKYNSWWDLNAHKRTNYLSDRIQIQFMGLLRIETQYLKCGRKLGVPETSNNKQARLTVA